MIQALVKLELFSKHWLPITCLYVLWLLFFHQLRTIESTFSDWSIFKLLQSILSEWERFSTCGTLALFLFLMNTARSSFLAASTSSFLWSFCVKSFKKTLFESGSQQSLTVEFGNKDYSLPSSLTTFLVMFNWWFTIDYDNTSISRVYVQLCSTELRNTS